MQVVVRTGSDNTDTYMYNACDDDVSDSEYWLGLSNKSDSASDCRFRCTSISS